ncbi:MAG TPA: hypothetical protein VKC54_01600 [Patescibacteria group bacterium]|nr:hypothetical protein [Patescibacteria group bacterium]
MEKEKQINTSFYIEELQEVFAKELTPELAKVYVDSLIAKLGGSNQSLESLTKKGSELHFKIGKELYGPLLVGFSQWVAKKIDEIGHSGPIFFALRDGAPLKTAADTMWNGKSIYPVGIYANRPLMGIKDEISPEWSDVNGNLVEYLKSLGLVDTKKAIWIDSGAWGTVPKVLKKNMLQHSEFYPLFWYSHNPYIPGFLNELISANGIDAKFGEILNDSLECVFPQPYKRPLDIFQDKLGWQIGLEPSGLLSLKWGQAALAGVQQCAQEKFISGGVSVEEESEALHALVHLSKYAEKNNIWTGVLPTNTPTWSEGEKFLTNWPINLLP